MNTPAQCGVIKPPKTDIYSEAPHSTPTPPASQHSNEASTTTATSPNATNNTSPKSRLDKHRSIIVDTIIAWTDEILAWHHSDRACGCRKLGRGR